LTRSGSSRMTLDIVFMMDATGSMSSWMPSVKGNIVGIAKELVPAVKKAHPSLKLHIRFGALGFRDFSDAAQVQHPPPPSLMILPPGT
jgi:hypothetical protein